MPLLGRYSAFSNRDVLRSGTLKAEQFRPLHIAVHVKVSFALAY